MDLFEPVVRACRDYGVVSKAFREVGSGRGGGGGEGSVSYQAAAEDKLSLVHFYLVLAILAAGCLAGSAALAAEKAFGEACCGRRARRSLHLVV